jgi:hypothetical protein
MANLGDEMFSFCDDWHAGGFFFLILCFEAQRSFVSIHAVGTSAEHLIKFADKTGK